MPSLNQELEKAGAGLLHMSESDYPFRFFTLPPVDDDVPGLTAAEFLHRLGLTEQPIEERPLAGFFPSLDRLAEASGTSRKDPAVVAESKRWRNLEAVLRKCLRDVKVFRIGRVDIRCFVAGLDAKGNVAGLVTTAIET
jgi:hypothetical protein